MEYFANTFLDATIPLAAYLILLLVTILIMGSGARETDSSYTPVAGEEVD